MKTLVFKGYGDDTAGCYWDGGGIEHDDCASGTMRVFHVRDADHSMAVCMAYGAASMWTIGIGPIDDDLPLPPWPMRWRFSGYTTILELDVQDAEIALVACVDMQLDHDWKKIEYWPEDR